MILIPILLGYPLAVIPFLLIFKSRRLNDLAILSYALLFAGISVALYLKPAQFTPFLAVDSLNILFLLVLAFLFLAISVYNVGYMRHSKESVRNQTWYTVFFLLFIVSMAAVVLAQHLALLWVFLEATTLSSAPLIYFERSRASIEAAWKYIFICSIGIALAFVGIILLSLSTGHLDSLFFVDLYKNASGLSKLWLKLSFPFILVGMGSKMGLAPVHAWLPDAHPEAPTPVSALLSATQINMPLLGILRVFKLMALADLTHFASTLVLIMGFLSLLVSAVFIMRTNNIKRMLAYSSIENMGIIAIAIGGVGVGNSYSIGLYVALLHMVAHSLAKGAFFLTAGNIVHLYKTKKIDEVNGLLATDKINGWLWLGSFAAICAIPPFPAFLSEFLLVKEMFAAGGWAIFRVVLFFLFMTIILFAMGRSVLSMTFGLKAAHIELPKGKIHLTSILPPLLLLLVLLILGLSMPETVQSLLKQATRELWPLAAF